jgi:hypothetical protein
MESADPTWVPVQDHGGRASWLFADSIARRKPFEASHNSFGIAQGSFAPYTFILLAAETPTPINLPPVLGKWAFSSFDSGGSL